MTISPSVFKCSNSLSHNIVILSVIHLWRQCSLPPSHTEPLMGWEMRTFNLPFAAYYDTIKLLTQTQKLFLIFCMYFKVGGQIFLRVKLHRNNKSGFIFNSYRSPFAACMAPSKEILRPRLPVYPRLSKKWSADSALFSSGSITRC